MRRFALVVVAILFFGGCEKRKPATSEFRVALVTTGSVGDGGWNATAFDGLQKIKSELKAHVANIETRSPAEYEEAFRDFASRDYKLIFGHGFEYQDAAMKVAPMFPNTTFVITSGAEAKDNVVPIIFSFGEATYLAGIAAAAVSKSGRLGAIGGQPFPPVKDGFAKFEEGARVINPNISLVTAYVGNWEDAAAAKEAAKAQLQTGVDVIIQNADAAGMGVFQAIREMPETYAIGTNANQNAVAPDHILGSAVIDVPAAFLKVAKQAQAGSPPRGVLRLGMKDNVVRFEQNERLAGKYGKAMSAIEDAKARFVASPP